jgi:flavin-dependent dehydrogenase
VTQLARQPLGQGRDEAFRATSKIRGGALHVDGDQLTARPLPQVDGLPSYGRVIPRLQLDAWVLDAARQAGAAVLDGRKVTAVEQAPGAVTVRGQGAAGPWQLRARLLLGADGSNSTVARALRGSPPPRQDRILAVRAYFDHVGGPAGQGDIYFCSDSFPGYYWLFPASGAQANVGVGMVLSTYPHTGRNLRELLLRLIAGDTAMQHRLRGRPDGRKGPRLPADDLQSPAAAGRRPRDAGRRRRRADQPAQRRRNPVRAAKRPVGLPTSPPAVFLPASWMRCRWKATSGWCIIASGRTWRSPGSSSRSSATAT